MGAAVALREDYRAEDLRQLASRCKDANQVRRLLSLAAIREGRNRSEAARIGGMDRQTLRDWVIAFNQSGPQGLINRKAPGRQPKLNAAQKADIKALVERGPDSEKDGVVRWRCVDLKRVIQEQFGIEVDEVTVGRMLKQLGFAHVSARPRSLPQDQVEIETFKKLCGKGR